METNETQTQQVVTVSALADPVDGAPVKPRGVYAKKSSAWPNATWTWSDGRTDVVDVTSFPEDTQHELALHGLKQKLGDAYSGSKTLDDAKGMFDKALDALRQGWTSRASGGEADDPVETLASAVFSALTEYFQAGKCKEPVFAETLAKVQAAEPAERRKYKQDPKVAYFLAELKKRSEESPLAGLM
jgi:hypothetical protein